MFSSNDPNQAPMRALNIDPSLLARIHTVALKKEYLLYKYLCFELDQVKSALSMNFPVQYVMQSIEHGFNYYQMLLQSPIVTRHRSHYSTDSKGLNELDIRSLIKQEDKLDQVGVSVLYTADKKSGVEPGFQAIQKQDILFYLYRTYPALNARLMILENDEGDLEKLLVRFKDHLPTYLVKLTYHQKKGQTKLKPEHHDVKRTHTIQRLYEKSDFLGNVAVRVYCESKASTPLEKNGEAILEVIANDVARVYGLTVQDQVLYRQNHRNGAMKLTLKAPWEKNACPIQPLQGGKHHDDVKVVAAPVNLNGISALADPIMNGFAEYLFLFLAQGSYDSIGSNGGNKLIRNQQLFGIDFGHAYEEIITDKIALNFQVKDARFKNFSVFYAAPRSMQVRGLLRLARLANKLISPTVLKSYGDAFKNAWEAIPAHADEAIFADYMRKFQEIADEYKAQGAGKEDNAKDCAKLVQKIKETKIAACKARDGLLEKFKDYLHLPCDAVDLIAQLEKWLEGKDNTSLRSPDSTVLLNHVRIVNPGNIVWKKLQYRAPHYSLQAELKNAAIKGVENLQARMQGLADNLGITLIQRDKLLEMTFHERSLPALLAVLSDVKLATAYHPDDAALALHYETIQKLQASMDVLKKELQLAPVLVVNQVGFYALAFPAPQNPLLDTLIQEHCAFLIRANQTYSAALTPETLPTALDCLAALPQLFLKKCAFEDSMAQHQSRIEASLKACAEKSNSTSFLYQVTRLNDQWHFAADPHMPALARAALAPIFSEKTVFQLDELPALQLVLALAPKTIAQAYARMNAKLNEMQAMVTNINAELSIPAITIQCDWVSGQFTLKNTLNSLPRLLQLMPISFNQPCPFAAIDTVNAQLQRGINAYRLAVHSEALAARERSRLDAQRQTLEEDFLSSAEKLREQLNDDLLFTLQLAPFDPICERYALHLGEAADEGWMSTVKTELHRFGNDPMHLSLTMAELAELNELLPELVTRHAANKRIKAEELAVITQQVLDTLRALSKKLHEQHFQPQSFYKQTLFHVNAYIQSKPTAAKMASALIDILDPTKPFSGEQASSLKDQIIDRKNHVATLKEKDPKREEEQALLEEILQQLTLYLDLMPPSAPQPASPGLAS